MKPVLIILLLSLFSNVHAETDGWVTRDGKPVPNSDAIKSMNGFGGWLVVTPDSDWEAKWKTSPESTPYITEAKNVSYGEQLTVLPFYINPKANDFGEIDVSCDIKIARPDGSLSVNAKDVQCASGKLQGNPRNIRLTSAIIKYVGEEGDLAGKWTVEVTLIDKTRGTSIPLRTYFVLLKTKASNYIQSDRARSTTPAM